VGLCGTDPSIFKIPQKLFQISRLPRSSPNTALRNTEVKSIIESEDEFTDDEAYLKRHRALEAEEVKRYNIGLDKKDQLKAQ
jgi:hypothetical protein